MIKAKPQRNMPNIYQDQGKQAIKTEGTSSKQTLCQYRSHKPNKNPSQQAKLYAKHQPLPQIKPANTCTFV